ncbi:MAG: hypothetical protein H0U57_09195 [Tatlockia sp.]|nr:hypothetical protein [Tatlockia sp.]
MKTYQNPQPHAVERKTNSSGLPNTEAGELKKPLDIDKEPTTEIFLEESEEEAWKDALKKSNPRDE